MKWVNYILVNITLIIIAGCSTTGNGLGGNEKSKIYDTKYNRMTEVVQQAIKSYNLDITYIDDSDKYNKLYLVFVYHQTARTGSGKGERGNVKIEKINKNSTKVTIENPEYHYSVPDRQRKDFAKIIFNRIKNNLN